jgi:hypothetical protein
MQQLLIAEMQPSQDLWWKKSMHYFKSIHYFGRRTDIFGLARHNRVVLSQLDHCEKTPKGFIS